MSFLSGKRAGRRLGAVVLAVAAGGALACNVDREDVMFQKGDYVFDFLIDATLRGGFPDGSVTITEYAVGGTDLTAADGFERSIDGNRSFYSSSGSQFGGAYNITDYLRNGSQDVRLPALVENDAAVGSGTDGIVILDDSGLGFGGGYHNTFNDAAITGLKPNTVYLLAFFRYSLTVNGTLDAAQVLLGETVDQPDQLSPLGGTPGGDPSQAIESYPTFVSYVSGANPFIVGNFTTDGDGNGFFDSVIDGTGTLYSDDSGDPPDAAFDSSLVARNDDVATALPRYNYIVILEGPATDAADAADNPQAVRFQIAQDLDASGNPINNSYAPFPDGALDTETLLGFPCCAGQASSLELAFDNLMGLQGDVYQVWLWNEETSDLISPNGDWVATEPDAEGNPVEVGSASDVNSFASQAGWTHTFTTSDAQAGQAVGQFTHVFLSKESASAGSPSTSQPLWAQFTNMAGAPEDPFQWTFNSPEPTLFGTFGSGDPTELVLGLARGEGGFWGEQVGNSDLLVVVYRNLPLPPRGYFYNAWLVADDGTEVDAGELKSVAEEGYVSLLNIDEDPGLTSFVNERDGIIIQSETRTVEADLPDGMHFYDFVEYRLVLSPKETPDAMPPTTVLGNETPEPLRNRQPEPENGGG